MNQSEYIAYWDNASTTKVDQRVVDSMLPYFTEFFGNASSNHPVSYTHLTLQTKRIV